jgi:acetyltransferase-like isoleucine patch superfamily enzyme
MHLSELLMDNSMLHIILAPIQRFLQLLARIAPGATTLRVWLHRCRGVKLGKNVWIGYDAILETSSPHLVKIDDEAVIGIRSMLIAHFRESQGITISKGAVIGPGVIVMPNVTIGEGAVVAAGSVVTTSVPPMTLVQGNPAKPVAKIGVLLGRETPAMEFVSNLKPIRR